MNMHGAIGSEISMMGVVPWWVECRARAHEEYLSHRELEGFTWISRYLQCLRRSLGFSLVSALITTLFFMLVSLAADLK